MQYRDKSTGQTVNLKDSATKFLALTDPTEQESISPLVSQPVFIVRASTNNDGVYILEIKSEAESPVAINRVINELRRDARIKEVVPAMVDDQGQTRFALPNRVVVEFSGASTQWVRSFLDQIGSNVVRQFRSPGLFEVTVPDGMDPGEFIDTLNSNDRTAYAEPSFYAINDADVRVSVSVATGTVTPSNNNTGGNGSVPPAGTTLSWNLEKIALRQAWQRTTGRREIIVAVVDGMPDVTHEALAGKQIVALSERQIFSANRSVSSHATSICSIIAGESSRFVGVAPGIRLLPLVTNLDSQLYAERADAINFAIACAQRRRVGQTRIRRLVLSCSWRTSGDIAVIRNALRRAVEAGVVAVFSAGNNGANELHYPSSYSGRPDTLGVGLIAVAATTQSDQKADYSNYGSAISLAAPGGDGLPIDVRDVPCADQGDLYGFAAGTSIAVPHVSAVAALLLSIRPELSAAEIKRLIVSTTDLINRQNPAYRDLLGTGRLNAHRALAAAAIVGNGEGEELPAEDDGPKGQSGPHVTVEISGRRRNKQTKP